MLKQIQFILLLVFVIEAVNAQSTDTVGYGWGFLKGELHLLKSPLRIEKKNILPLSSIAIAGGVLFAFDEQINIAVQELRANQGLDMLAEGVTFIGDPFSLTLIPITSLVIGKVTKNQGLKHTSEVAGASVVHAAIITLATKAITGRKRPNQSNVSNDWSGFSTEYLSFPSFHAAGSWALATSIARSYPDKKILGVACYAVATGVSISRVYLNEHWSSDVFWGAALGFGIGSSMVKFHKNDHFTFSPFFGEKTGASILISF